MVAAVAAAESSFLAQYPEVKADLLISAHRIRFTSSLICQAHFYLEIQG